MLFENLPGVMKCTFQTGERLLSAGDELDGIYYLAKGSVYRVMTRASGTETIVSEKIGGKGVSSLVGIFIIYTEDQPYTVANDFIAQSECICYRIPIDTCREYIRQHLAMLEQLLYEFGREYRFMADRFWSSKEKSAPASLCVFLLKYSKHYGDKRILPKKYTNIEISKFISVHRVTVANILRALRNNGCIERSECGLLLKNVDLIKDYAEHRKILEYKG